MAGIGNIYADEILFQASLHPSVAASMLDRSATHRLFDVMKACCRRQSIVVLERSPLRIACRRRSCCPTATPVAGVRAVVARSRRTGAVDAPVTIFRNVSHDRIEIAGEPR
jgi:hypothetical protein